MKVLILNGSPREGSNSGAFAKAVAEGALSVGHEATIIDIAKLNINGCIACEYCHGKGEGSCIQQDDMQGLYNNLNEADIIIFASPIYYWSLSGQMQSLITRLYNSGKPAKAEKYALILSSYSPNVYDAPISQFNSIMSYWGTELCGQFTFNGANQQTKANLNILRDFGAGL